MYPFLHYLSITIQPFQFVPVLEAYNPTWNKEIAEDFVCTTTKYKDFRSSMNVTPVNRSGVMDNSANVHVVKDETLFVGPILPCPVNADVGTVVGSNPPKGIGLARIQWEDNQGLHHEADLVDALYFPDSPVNVVSVTKLGIDRKDPRLNI